MPIENSGGVDRQRDDWNVEGLTGFSLRFGGDNGIGDSDGGQDSLIGQLIIETYVRERILFIDVNNTFDPTRDGTVVRYHVEQADGTPAPDWIRIVRDGFIVAERPVNLFDLRLKISAEMSDGTRISRSVQIDGPTGEIQPLADGEESRLLNGPSAENRTFGDQLRALVEPPAEAYASNQDKAANED